MLDYLIASDDWETPPALPPPTRPTSVLILGAGIAGLVAGYELMNRGYDVRMVEARVTAGGRVQTLREGFSGGVYAEAGATFLPLKHGLPVYYTRLLNLNLTGFSGSELPCIYYVKGQRITHSPTGSTDWPYALTPAERQMGLDQMQQIYTSPLALAGVPKQEATESTRLMLEDAVTLTKYMLGEGASHGAVELLNVGLNQLIGEGPSRYSAAMMLISDHYLAQNISSGGLQLKKVEGGNDRLPAALAAKLGSRVQYSTEVIQITQDANQVRITCRDNNGQHEASADYAICALPFSVLRDIPVSPGYSPAKGEAVRNMRYTSVTRIFLEMRQQFWRPVLSGEIISDQPMTVVYPAYNPPDQPGILGLYMASENARCAGALSLNEQIEFGLSQIEPIYNEARQYFTGGVSKVWDDDPFAKGAYAWFAPGEMTSILPAAVLPEGRIYFAGEHASTLPGWIQGAMASGLRAAADIAEAASAATP